MFSNLSGRCFHSEKGSQGGLWIICVGGTLLSETTHRAGRSSVRLHGATDELNTALGREEGSYPCILSSSGWLGSRCDLTRGKTFWGFSWSDIEKKSQLPQSMTSQSATNISALPFEDAAAPWGCTWHMKNHSRKKADLFLSVHHDTRSNLELWPWHSSTSLSWHHLCAEAHRA